MTRTQIGLLLALALCWTACSPTYAPPVRGVHYGAPGRLEEGRIELGGTAGGPYIPQAGGPNLAIGVKDYVAIEAGGSFNAFDSGGWAMGYVGPRFTLAPARRQGTFFALDLEAGVGLGVGGTREGGGDWKDRLAYGGYQGLGLGVHFAGAAWRRRGLASALYLRARVEETTARALPTTYWVTAMLGLDLSIARRVTLGVGVGYAEYSNAADRIGGLFYQLGVTVFFDAFGKARRPPQVPPPAAPAAAAPLLLPPPPPVPLPAPLVPRAVVSPGLTVTGLGQCPDPAAVHLRVLTLLAGRSDPELRRAAIVSLVYLADALKLELQLAPPGPSHRSVRLVPAIGAGCEALGEAAALIIASWLDQVAGDPVP